jgi:hypothetical protein
MEESVDGFFDKLWAKISRGDAQPFSRLIESSLLCSIPSLGDFVISHFRLLFGVFIKTAPAGRIAHALTLTNWVLGGDHDGHPDGGFSSPAAKV